MSNNYSPGLDFQFSHHYGQFESSQLSNTFLDGIRPLAESSAIKPIIPKTNATYSIIHNAPVLSPSALKSSSSHGASLNILNLDSLSSRLLSLSPPDARNKDWHSASIDAEEDKADVDAGGVYLNADELRHLEDAFSDFSTAPRDTGAIATSTLENANGLGVSQSSGRATNVSSLPSLSCDSDSKAMPQFGNLEDDTDVNQDVAVRENQENQPPDDAHKDLHSCDLDSNHPEVYCYGRPLSTIVEWQSRESFSSTTAYQAKSQVYEKLGDTFTGNETSENAPASVFMSKLSVPSHAAAHGLRKSGVLQSSSITNNPKSPNCPISTFSSSQMNASSSSRDSASKEAKCNLPAHLSSSFSGPAESGESQRSLDYDQTGYFIPNVGYWFVNQVSKPTDGDESKEPQVLPSPAPRASLARTLNTMPVSVPPLDLSALAQTTPSTANSTTAAFGAVNSSSSPAHLTRDSSMVLRSTLPSNEIKKDDPMADSSAETYAIATQTVSQECSGTRAKDTKTTCEVELNSSTLSNATTSPEAPPEASDVGLHKDENRRNLSTVGKATNEAIVTEDGRNVHPLMATSRCLFWNACIYGHEKNQQFVLRQDSDRLMKVKLQITQGKEFFTLLDHRGHATQKGSRVIELPPRLTCTVTVVYRPRPPLFWHTGILTFRELPRKRDASAQDLNPRCYLQRLIGYVAGSSVQCDFCRGVDEKTYWTSAFSTPTDVDRPLQAAPSYYARVSINNVGLRAAWVFAVAMKPNSDQDNSLTPLSGVRIRPARFVLRPSQSRDVIVSIADEPIEVKVLFYNGDEVIRYQCRKILASTGQPEQSPPRTLPRPHHRLRSAYIMRPFDGEAPDMSSELSISVSRDHYNWHAALQEEQRSRAPLSLTIYPLLTEASTSSFEASSSLIIGHHVEVDLPQIASENPHLSTSLETTAQVQWPSGESDTALGRFTSHSMGAAALTTPSRLEPDAFSPPVVRENPQTSLSPRSNSSPQPSKIPLITLHPDSQLIFAPCRSGSLTSATLQIELAALESSQSGECSSSTTSSRRRLSSLWRLYWRARPIGGEGLDSVFSYLVAPRPLLVEPGEQHHLPFCFRPPWDAPLNTRFSQRWLLSFHLSQDVTGPLLLNATFDEPTQEAEILFVGDTLNKPNQSSMLGPKIVVVKPLLKFRGIPVIFQHDNQQCQFDLINASHEERLTVIVGQINSPAFELIKPTSSKFFIEPRSSVRFLVTSRIAGMLKKNAKELTGFLPLWWSTGSDQTIRFERNVSFKAIL